MPSVVVERSKNPDVWITEDQNNKGVLLAITGFRVLNNKPWPIRVRISYGPTGTILDWWTPLGRTGDVLQVGEDVTSAPFRVAAGQADSFAVYAGLA